MTRAEDNPYLQDMSMEPEGGHRDLCAINTLHNLLFAHTGFINAKISKTAENFLKIMRGNVNRGIDGLVCYYRGSGAKSMGVRLRPDLSPVFEINPHVKKLDAVLSNLKEKTIDTNLPEYTRKALDKKPDIDLLLELPDNKTLEDIGKSLGFTRNGIIRDNGLEISWELRKNEHYTHAYLTLTDTETNQEVIFDLFAIPYQQDMFEANVRFGRGATFKDMQCIGHIVSDLRENENFFVTFNREFYTVMQLPSKPLDVFGWGASVGKHIASFMHTASERTSWRRKRMQSQLSLEPSYEKAVFNKILIEDFLLNKLEGWKDQIQRDAFRIAILASFEGEVAVLEFIELLHRSGVIKHLKNVDYNLKFSLAIKISYTIKALYESKCTKEDALWFITLFDPR